MDTMAQARAIATQMLSSLSTLPASQQGNAVYFTLMQISRSMAADTQSLVLSGVPILDAVSTVIARMIESVGAKSGMGDVDWSAISENTAQVANMVSEATSATMGLVSAGFDIADRVRAARDAASGSSSSSSGASTSAAPTIIYRDAEPSSPSWLSGSTPFLVLGGVAAVGAIVYFATKKK